MLTYIFGFAEHQEKATYGSGYKLTLTRSEDDSVLNKADAINNGKIQSLGLNGMYPITRLVWNNRR